MKKTQRMMTGLLIAASAFMAVEASAQSQSDTSSASSGYSWYGRGSSYVGLNAGRSDFKVGNGIGIFDRDDGDTIYNIYAGGYFNKNFGVELGYTDFGKINRAGGQTKADGINLSLIGKVPVGSSFNLLGKVGTTYGRTDVSSATGSGITPGSESGFDWSYGVGAEFAFSPQWSAVLQYDEHNLKYPGGNHDRVSATTLGVRYNF